MDSGTDRPESRFAEKYLVILVDTMVIMSQQCILAAKVAMRQSTASRSEGGEPYPSPLHSPAAFSLALRYEKDMHILEQVQHMTTNITTSPGEFIM